MNAELFRELSIIAEDESLMAKMLKYAKKLTAKKADSTLMTHKEFFDRIVKRGYIRQAILHGFTVKGRRKGPERIHQLAAEAFGQPVRCNGILDRIVLFQGLIVEFQILYRRIHLFRRYYPVLMDIQQRHIKAFFFESLQCVQYCMMLKSSRNDVHLPLLLSEHCA